MLLAREMLGMLGKPGASTEKHMINTTRVNRHQHHTLQAYWFRYRIWRNANNNDTDTYNTDTDNDNENNNNNNNNNNNGNNIK